MQGTTPRNRLNRPFHISEHSPNPAKETEQVRSTFSVSRNLKTASDQRRSIFQKDFPREYGVGPRWLLACDFSDADPGGVHPYTGSELY